MWFLVVSSTTWSYSRPTPTIRIQCNRSMSRPILTWLGTDWCGMQLVFNCTLCPAGAKGSRSVFRHRCQQTDRHRAAREHSRRRPLAPCGPRQSVAWMGVEGLGGGELEVLAPGGAVRPVKRAAAATAAANPNFHLSVFKPKILDRTWGVWNERFQLPNRFCVYNHKVTPLYHGNETISWFIL